MTFKAFTVVALLATATFAPALSRPAYGQIAQAQAATQPGTVSATGTARVYRVPEYIDIHLAIEVEAFTATEAQTRCAKDMESVLATIKAMGLEGYEPQTGTITLQPRYNERGDLSVRKVVGYTATNTVRVRTADLKAAPRTVDAALKTGANRVDGIAFGIKQYLAAREEALSMATKAAKRKAEVMANALDYELAQVVSVNESTPRYYSPMNRMAQVQMVNEGAGGDGIPSEESVVPGQIEILVEVNLTFAIKGR